MKKFTDLITPIFFFFFLFFFQTKTEVGEVMKSAQFSLAEAKFTCGDINHTVLQSVLKASIKVKSKKENVVGK